MYSQPPFNPYAPAQNPPPSGNGDQIGSLRERVAKLESNVPHLAAAIEEAKTNQERFWYRIQRIEQHGAEAVMRVPMLVADSLAPLTARMEKLEARWWAPLRPYLWRVYLGLAVLGFAFGWRRVTGEVLPVRLIVDWLLKNF